MVSFIELLDGVRIRQWVAAGATQPVPDVILILHNPVRRKIVVITRVSRAFSIKGKFQLVIGF
jgi:hypothetical protein